MLSGPVVSTWWGTCWKVNSQTPPQILDVIDFRVEPHSVFEQAPWMILMCVQAEVWILQEKTIVVVKH